MNSQWERYICYWYSTGSSNLPRIPNNCIIYPINYHHDDIAQLELYRSSMISLSNRHTMDQIKMLLISKQKSMSRYYHLRYDRDSLSIVAPRMTHGRRLVVASQPNVVVAYRSILIDLAARYCCCILLYFFAAAYCCICIVVFVDRRRHRRRRCHHSSSSEAITITNSPSYVSSPVITSVPPKLQAS